LQVKHKDDKKAAPDRTGKTGSGECPVVSSTGTEGPTARPDLRDARAPTRKAA